MGLLKQKARKLSLSILPLVVVTVCIILFLEIWIRIFAIPSYLIPTPSSVFYTLYDKLNYLFDHIAASTIEAVEGLGIGAVLGVIVGIVINKYKFTRDTIYPLLLMLNTVPKIALAPIIVVWFGYGMISKVMITFLIAFFPLLVNTVDGLRRVPSDMVNLAYTYQATTIQIYRKIRFPYALPYIFTGFKIASSAAVGGAIVAEFIASQAGIGYVMITAMTMLDTETMFVGVLLISILAVFFFYLAWGLEKKMVKWQPKA